MSSIRKELNELAIKIGAPIVGTNISEQIRAISTHLGGTSHGANISERIDELTKVFDSGSSDSTVIFAPVVVDPVYSPLTTVSQTEVE